MNKMIKLHLTKLTLIIAALFISGISNAVSAQVRTSPTPKSKVEIEVLYPEITFDEKAAKSALGRGTSTISGEACAFKDGRFYIAKNIKVSLFPVTPYFEEWYKLRKKKEGKNTAVYMSAEAYKNRIDTQTNADGKFQFTDMKPGKYFIQAIFDFTQTKTQSVYAGRVEGVFSSARVYRNETYRVAKRRRLEKTVELSKPGEVEKITMKSGFSGLMNTGCSKLGKKLFK